LDFLGLECFWILDFGFWSFSGAWLLVLGALTTIFDKRISTGIFFQKRRNRHVERSNSYARQV
jgi:hypothetical protein